MNPVLKMPNDKTWLPTPIALRQAPNVMFPTYLDDEHTIVEVYDRSQARLAHACEADDDAIHVEYDLNSREIWAPSGFVLIDQEYIYYSEVEYVLTAPPVLRSSGANSLFEHRAIQLAIPGARVLTDAITADDVGEAATRAMRAWGAKRFTLVGIVDVGGRHVAFACAGSGSHGAGAHFQFEDPALFEASLCAFDPVALDLTLAVQRVGARLKNAWWLEEGVDTIGEPARRVCVLKTLKRGYGKTQPAFHARHAWVRGPIMAEHHNLLAEAVAQLEKLTGEDLSTDRESQDFRLRDLDDRCLESDECPEGVIYVDEEVDECFRVRVIRYRVVITGEYTTMQVDFGDGTTSSSLEGTHQYPIGSPYEPRLLIANERCIVEDVPPNDQLPILQISLPDIITPEFVCPPPPPPPVIEPPPPQPPPPPDIINMSCPQPQTPQFTFPSFIPIQFSVSIPPIPPIVITVPEFSYPTPTLEFNYVINGPTASGPCVAIVPCSANTTGVPGVLTT